MKIMTVKAGIAAGLTFALAACGSETDIETAPGVSDRSGDTMAEVVGDVDDISAASAAFTSTGVSGALEGDASYTVFAPTNSAFDALGSDAAALLGDEENGAIVAALLRDHMVPGALTPDTITAAIDENGGQVTLATFGSGDLTLTLDGETIVVSNSGGQSARLGANPTVTSNGVLIPIDSVLADSAALSKPAGGQ